MDYTKLFYWLTVADNAKTFFLVFIVVFTAISGISTIAYFINSAQDDSDSPKYAAMCRKWMWWAYPFMVFFWSLYIFTPSKRDALLIVAGGQTMNFLTTDTTAKKIPHELSNFIVTELKSMANEAKVDLQGDKRQEYIDEAKRMTTEELMHRAKIDSAFKKAVLGD